MVLIKKILKFNTLDLHQHLLRIFLNYFFLKLLDILKFILLLTIRCKNLQKRISMYHLLNQLFNRTQIYLQNILKISMKLLILI